MRSCVLAKINSGAVASPNGFGAVGPTRATVRKWIASSAISTVANEEVHLPGPLR
jgi:hypothetical protein